MALQVIKNDAKELTSGETKLLNKIKSIYKDYKKEAYLYIQPNISSLVPDFILMDPSRGISILEVKDWSISYIRNINKKKVELQDRSDDNPVYKTKKYLSIAEGLISTSDDDMEFIEENIYANTVLTNISSSDIENTGISSSLNQPPVSYISSDNISKLSIDDLFSDEEINISEDEMITLRTLFFPETKIKKITKDLSGEVISTTIKALDSEQENFARRLPYGHYMVTGVPGSGKTVILMARALHLAKENPNWNIKILTYNNSLMNKIESTLNLLAKDIKDNLFLRDTPIQNISVTTFHKMAKDIANVHVPRPTPQNWWDETLPRLALDKAIPRYDAVLIDEYQDFRDDWIRLCIKVCKEYNYKNNSGKEVKGINLFMAGDRLQSIYNSKEHYWSDFGIDMRGRSKLLKTSYRAGKENATLALNFLQQNDDLVDEVSKFYKDTYDDDIEINDVDNKSSVEFVEGYYSSICDKVNDLIKSGYNYSDILIVCNTKDDCNKVKDHLPSNIRYNTKFVKDAKDEEMKRLLLTSTYYSSKGLEAKVTILVDTDRFTEQLDKSRDIQDRKLLYVGMTRASEKLLIHASNFNKDSFGKTIKDIYEGNLAFA